MSKQQASFIATQVSVFLFVIILFTVVIMSMKPEKVGTYGPPKPGATIVKDYGDGTFLYSDGTIGGSHGAQ